MQLWRHWSLLGLVLVMGCADPAAKNAGNPPVPTAPGAPAGLQPGAVDADAPEEFTTTASGLKYRIRRKSDGPKPTTSNTFIAHYKGWLDDGTEFDSSYKNGQPLALPVTQVVPGWTEGLQLIGKGGMIELEIPPELGYGPQGFPPVIPPNSTLHFILELIDIR